MKDTKDLEALDLEDVNEEESSPMELLGDILSDLMSVELDTSDLEGIKVDKTEFVKGVKGVSKIAGMFTCLKNVGMDTDSAVGFILNERNIEHAQKMQKLINESQEKIAKNTSINVESHQI